MSNNKESLNRPSTALLPMQDISTVLKLKYNHVTDNRELNTDGKMPNAFVPIDVENVGGESAEHIAVAAKDLSGNVPDRNTVENAKHLLNEKGMPLGTNDLVTQEDLGDTREIVRDFNKSYGGEIRDLRDEMYMLKAQLQKQGILKQVEPYSGFIDVFKKDNIKYLKSSLDDSFKISGVEQIDGPNQIRVQSIDEFKVGDYFVIHVKPTGDKKEFEYDENNKCTGSYDARYFLEQVVDIDRDTKAITFNRSIEGLNSKDLEVLKTVGNYYRGSFSNSLLEKGGYTERRFHTSMLDDTNIKNLNIIDSYAGYGASIKIPQENAGPLSSFRVKGQAFGSPGDLVCYVIEEDYIGHYTNRGRAIDDRKIIAESDYVKPENHVMFGDIIFNNFRNPNTGESVVLEGKNYCFIIKSLNSDNYGDHWSIQFSYHYDSATGGQDLQLNSILYKFKEIPFPASHGEKALIADHVINAYDLYYEVITKEQVLEQERPLSKGLYTARFKLPYPVEVSRARLTLRINREGLFNTKAKAITNANDYVDFQHDKTMGKFTMNTSKILNTDKVIIGSCFTDIKDAKDTSVKISKPVFYNMNDPVYRVGYNIQIRACNTKFDEGLNRFITSNELSKPLSMELKAVIPDTNNFSQIAKEYPTASDRLLFETEFNPVYDEEGHIKGHKKVNDFEVQIAWQSGYGIDQLIGYEELAGRLFDLSLSFDRNI